jgi:hypothetical protein
MKKFKTKKVNVKAEAKAQISKMLEQYFYEMGLVVHSNAADYGASEGTLFVEMPECDVQIKLVTPKAGISRYVPSTEF